MTHTPRPLSAPPNKVVLDFPASTRLPAPLLVSGTRKTFSPLQMDVFYLWGAALGILGLASHLLYFIHGEHHVQALRILKLCLLLPSLSLIGLTQLGGRQFSEAAAWTAWLTCAYVGALWTSMVVYRVFFHRLGGFPGPRLAKASKFYHSLCCYRMDNHQVRTRWHKQYGDFVRVGKQ